MLATFRTLVETQNDNPRVWRAELLKIRHSMNVIAKWVRYVCGAEDAPRWQIDALDEYLENFEWFIKHKRRVQFKWIQATEIRRNRLYPAPPMFDSVLIYRWLVGWDLSVPVTERLSPSPVSTEPVVSVSQADEQSSD